MPRQEERETAEIKIDIDPKTGRFRGLSGPPEELPKALNMLIASFLDSLNKSLGEFNKSSARYSKALLCLTVALILIAIIQVVAFFVG